MVVELAVGRVLAPQLGVSLDTWSALIGLVLGGLALGGAVGGWCADRWPTRMVLSAALVAAAWATLAILPLAELPPPRWIGSTEVVERIVWQSALLVVAPSLALGAVTPASARLLVQARENAGRRLGLLYALGAVGSIVGTFLTGFVLIDWVGSRPSIALAAAALALLGLIGMGAPVSGVGESAAWGLRAAAILPFVGLALAAGVLRGPCMMESSYFCIQVQERAGSGGVALRALLLDKLLHSYNAPDEPTYLDYGYTRIFADVARVQAEDRPDVGALFVGGGGYTVPRWLEASYPHAQIDVVEIDPKVTRAAELHLGLQPDTRIRTFNEDARQFFIAGRGGGYDLIFGDAFNDLSIPFQLTTAQFAEQVRGSLAPGGLYAANIIDLFPAGDFLRAYLATLRTVFPHIAVMLEPQQSSSSPWGDGPTPSGRERSTFVVLAGTSPLPLERIAAQPGAPGVVLTLEQFERLVGPAEGPILTDDYAPVDALTRRIFLSRRQ
jgi:hypothetical protein